MAFDPDAYLAAPAFDPDAYLAKPRGETSAGPPAPSADGIPRPSDREWYAQRQAEIARQEAEKPWWKRVPDPLEAVEEVLGRGYNVLARNVPGFGPPLFDRPDLVAGALSLAESFGPTPMTAAPVAGAAAAATELGMARAAAVARGIGAGATGVRTTAQALTGSLARRAQTGLAESITSGQFAADIAAGRRVATAADLTALNDLDAMWGQGLKEVAQGDLAAVRGVLEAAPATETVGANLLDRVTNNLNALRGNRATISENLYGEATEAMEARFAEGDYFQTSKPGQTLISELQGLAEPSLEKGTQIATAQARFIKNEVLPNLLGSEIRGAPEALREAAGGGLELSAAVPGGMAYARAEPVRNILRRLRDIAGGLPEEGYGAISQQWAGKLADKIAGALELWEPKLAAADANYRKLSEALEPFQTKLGRSIATSERFDRNMLATDPSAVPPMFFKTPATVRQLITLSGGDQAAVEEAAVAFARRELAGKTPEAAWKWLSGAEWLDALPNARQQLGEDVGRLVTADAEIARAGKFAQETGKRRDEILSTTRRLDEKVAQLAENLRSGVTPAGDAEKQARQLLANEISTAGIPPETRGRLVAQLNRVAELVEQQRRIRTTAKYVAATLGLGSPALHGLGVW